MAAVRIVYDTATAFVVHGMEHLLGLKGNPQEIERVQFSAGHADCVLVGFNTHQCAGACRVNSSMQTELRLKCGSALISAC